MHYVVLTRTCWHAGAFKGLAVEEADGLAALFDYLYQRLSGVNFSLMSFAAFSWA